MRIAIDLDDTVFTCNSLIYKIANFISPMKRKTKKLKYTTIVDKIKLNKFHERIRSVSRMGNLEYYKEIENSTSLISELHKRGIKIVFLSSRPNLKFMHNVLIDFLNNHGINYNYIVLACSNKYGFCKEANVDLLIDNKLANCVNCLGSKIKPIWYKKKLTDEKKARYKKMGINIAEDWNSIFDMVLVAKEQLENPNQKQQAQE